MKITLQMLQDKNACESQVKLFTKAFPKGSVSVTKTVCLKYAQVFEWIWAANKFLNPKQWEAYEKAIDTAWEAYEKAIAPAGKAYQKAIDTAWEAYQKAIASAGKAYRKAKAIAFYEASKI